MNTSRLCTTVPFTQGVRYYVLPSNYKSTKPHYARKTPSILSNNQNNGNHSYKPQQQQQHHHNQQQPHQQTYKQQEPIINYDRDGMSAKVFGPDNLMIHSLVMGNKKDQQLQKEANEKEKEQHLDHNEDEDGEVSNDTTTSTTASSIPYVSLRGTILSFIRFIKKESPQFYNLLKLKHKQRQEESNEESKGTTIHIPQTILDCLIVPAHGVPSPTLGKYDYLGNLMINQILNELKEERKMNHEDFTEIRGIINSRYYQRKKCEEIGFDNCLRIVISDEENRENYKPYINSYFKSKCLIRFIGVMYLEGGLEITRNFILSSIINKSLEKIVTENPESELLTKLLRYKIESPSFQLTLPSPGNGPLFKSMIYSGDKLISFAYGASESEAVNTNVDVLNQKMDSISSVLGLLTHNKEPLSDVNSLRMKIYLEKREQEHQT